MKTTLDLPDGILERTKIAAAKRRITLESLLVEALELVLRDEAPTSPPADALERLNKGFRLGGKPLTRYEAHAR